MRVTPPQIRTSGCPLSEWIKTVSRSLLGEVTLFPLTLLVCPESLLLPQMMVL